MILIEYLDSTIFGEPGPNICFMGSRSDFALFRTALCEIANGNKQYIEVSVLPFVELRNLTRVRFEQKSGGTILNSFRAGELLIQLDRKYWNKIVGLLEPLTFEACHVYLDLDEDNLKEDVCLILSSEQIT